jgi:hypothetical protein
MPQSEFARYTNSPSLEQTFVDWQFNAGSPAVYVRDRLLDYRYNMEEVLNKIYGEDEESFIGISPEELAELFRPFRITHFIINPETATVRIDPEVIAESEAAHRASGKQLVQRNCPVAYTREFHEMWRWLIAIVSYQLYDTPYPEYKAEHPSRLPDAFRAQIKEDIRIAVDPYVQYVSNKNTFIDHV